MPNTTDPYLRLLSAAAGLLYHAAQAAKWQGDPKRIEFASDTRDDITHFVETCTGTAPPDPAAPPAVPPKAAASADPLQWATALHVLLESRPRRAMIAAGAADRLGIPVAELVRMAAEHPLFHVESGVWICLRPLNAHPSALNAR